MTAPCGCCEGIERVTPIPLANRPGLSALAYRVGTHATFLETMLARLPSTTVDDSRRRPLAGLTTRATDDPAVAFLDAWAVVADVLAFYQERIANEGYLRTATERRSVLELARLVGYRLRPGVAASVHLAYTLEKGARVTIAAGSRAQSLPGPGELPQPFETSDPLEARAEWNDLEVRRTRPQQAASSAQIPEVLYFAGTATNLKANDALLPTFGETEKPSTTVKPLLFVRSVEAQAAHDRTRVVVEEPDDIAATSTNLTELVKPLLTSPARPLANALRLPRDLRSLFGIEAPVEPTPGVALARAAGPVTRPTAVGELTTRVFTRFQPALAPTLYEAWRQASTTDPAKLRNVYVLRRKAALFGSNAPLQLELVPDGEGDEKLYTLEEAALRKVWLGPTEDDTRLTRDRNKGVLTLLLDAEYDDVVPGSWVGVVTSSVRTKPTTLHAVAEARSVSMTVVGVAMRVTELTLETAWLSDDEWKNGGSKPDFLRSTTIHVHSEALPLAEEPMPEPVEKGEIQLAGLYDGLDSGRWLIVCGEREDTAVPVHGCELVLLAGVSQRAGGADGKLLGDMTHTVLTVSPELKFHYDRETVTIYGNVVKATHGETRDEVLGSGDGSKALQQFTLKQAPVTYLPSPTPEGAQSTLRVRVNELEWREAPNLFVLGETDQAHITTTDDDEKTTVVFGTGKQGVRPPSGVENLRAHYRSGIGRAGNAKAGQVSLLATRPLGVKAVVNPLRASGGADADTRDEARRNAPLAVAALDRLVSVSDYADFSRTFAGIGKAAASRLTDGHREVVHVTIAGAGDVPIDRHSDLYLNLCRALRDAGDPSLPIIVDERQLMALVLSCKVALRPGYLWEPVARQLRLVVTDAFGFERQELGQDVVLSQVQSAMQAVDGVAWVDVDAFGAIPETDDPAKIVAAVAAITITDTITDRIHVGMAVGNGTIRPAQIAYFLPDVPDTLIINPVTS